MERQVSLDEISDGKLYGSNDMVKADCNDCKGCFACCKGMGKSIVLDPLDLFRMTSYRDITFEQMLVDEIELNVVDGIILPNLKMSGSEERCTFLNENGRCSIHPFRPGICRLFPLGRYYEDHTFYYFLQIHECKKENRTKVKVKKWIDTPDIKKYETFVNDWHYFLKELQNKIKQQKEGFTAKTISMYVLQQFYMLPYDKNDDFYTQFNQRLEKANMQLNR
ncbi:MAG: YkgJ family cysteine cluster protein [Clostridiales bacterium]|nr:YkgJ family cysteine cluster protein [Clostridiales bacterium]